jgi:hypothetical protein
MRKVIIIVVSLLLTVTGIGCIALSHHITPAEVDIKAVKYVVEADIAEPNEYSGWPNLAKALRLQEDIDIAYEVNLFDIKYMLDKENLAYSIHRDTVKADAAVGLQREEMLFGEKGLLSLGLSLAGVGTLTGVIGLMRKRPGDITQQEMEQTLSTVTGEATSVLSVKDKQLIQVVKGISNFMDTYKDNDKVITDIKLAANGAQDTDTRIAVSVAKKGV